MTKHIYLLLAFALACVLAAVVATFFSALMLPVIFHKATELLYLDLKEQHGRHR